MEISKGNKTALLFGGSGLVGGFVLELLLMHPAYTKVVSFGRKALETEHEKLEQVVLKLDRLKEFRSRLKGDDIFLCLGTTMKKAGSKEAFYQVDFEYNYGAARLAVEEGVNQLMMVSSVGASENSNFYYLRVKGELEEEVKKLPFWSTHIFQPSLLLGSRNENRWGEEIAGKIGSVLNTISGGLLNKYKPVEADVVAKAMVEAAQGLREGLHVYPSHWLQEMAEKTDRQLKKY